jgi:hypothetical protein
MSQVILKLFKQSADQRRIFLNVRAGQEFQFIPAKTLF